MPTNQVLRVSRLTSTYEIDHTNMKVNWVRITFYTEEANGVSCFELTHDLAKSLIEQLQGLPTADPQ